MATLLLTVVLFAIAMFIMSIGVLFRRRCLRGSCGGPQVFGSDGEPLTCDHCPRRHENESTHPEGSVSTRRPGEYENA